MSESLMGFPSHIFNQRCRIIRTSLKKKEKEKNYLFSIANYMFLALLLFLLSLRKLINLRFEQFLSECFSFRYLG